VEKMKEVLWTGLGWTIALLVSLGLVVLSVVPFALLGWFLEPILEEWLKW
jgi:hypothetical protein